MSIWRTIFSRQFFLTLALIGLLVLFAIPLTRNWRQKHEIDREIAELEIQSKELEHKNSSLKQVLDYMQSDQFVEHEARTKLNYKKPGEQVVVIETPPGQDQPTTNTANLFDLPVAENVPQDARLLGNVGRWLNYFFPAKKL